MRCPFCDSHDTQVLDTRTNPEVNAVRRRRKCGACAKRFTTFEKVELRMPRLMKKDGTRSDFDREKLSSSMMVALRKRHVATERVDLAIDRIEEKLRSSGEREIATAHIGELVMHELALLDQVAFIRFASVYRSFDTPEDFRVAAQAVDAPLSLRKPRRTRTR